MKGSTVKWDKPKKCLIINTKCNTGGRVFTFNCGTYGMIFFCVFLAC